MVSVETFVKEYNHANDKQEYLSKHIINKYVNYEEKMTRCENIAEKTMYKEVNGKTVFWQNTPLQHYFFCLELLWRYTDIDLGTGAELLKNYNLLNKNNLITEIISAIPQTEYAEFRTVLDMVVQDKLENERSLPSFIETKMDAVQLGLETIGSVFKEMNLDGLSEVLQNIPLNDEVGDFTEV